MKDSIYEIGTPVYVPEGVSDLPRLLAASFDAFKAGLLGLIEEFLAARSREAFLRLEESVVRVLMVVSSHIVAGIMALLHQDEAWVDGAVREARSETPRPTRPVGLERPGYGSWVARS